MRLMRTLRFWSTRIYLAVVRLGLEEQPRDAEITSISEQMMWKCILAGGKLPPGSVISVSSQHRGCLIQTVLSNHAESGEWSFPPELSQSSPEVRSFLERSGNSSPLT